MPQSNGRNPFQEVYLTETLEDPELYWSLFSPQILSGEAKTLYHRGNMVLKGSNGAGKTMLLRLFSPEVQAAYLNHNEPVPSHESIEYINIGVNFIHAGFGGLGGRCASDAPQSELWTWALSVADMLNYFLIYELLRTLAFLDTPSGARLREAVGVKVDLETRNLFATNLAQRSCWFGALNECNTFNSLIQTIRQRLEDYRAFWNLNYDVLPTSIARSRSEVGVPLSEAHEAMSESGVITRGATLMVTLDQYDTLYHTDYGERAGEVGPLGRLFCQIINSLLARRDHAVSYKVGVRPYSWGRELRVLGSDATIEVQRDYQVIDIDEIFRRKENTGAWLFPKFARDVARRRLGERGDEAEGGGWIDRFETLGVDDELRKYCQRDADRLLPVDESLPPGWTNMLKTLYKESRYKAVLAAVWIKQKKGGGGALPAEASAIGPWERDWWQKERREAILMQAASRCRQRRLYGGWDTLMDLSGSQILVFLSLCREIWDIWKRSANGQRGRDGQISVEIQSQAIRIVAASWLAKLDEFPAGPRRRNFVTRLGIGARRALLDDIGLVYPGRTGFSIKDAELESAEGREVRAFLRDAADFGALVSRQHTTKEATKELRTKWYLFPVLCPNFDIPVARTKEPYYAKLDEVKSWVKEGTRVEFKRPWANGRSRRSKAESEGGLQGGLFSGRTEESD